MIQASKPLKRLLQGDKGRASLVTDKTKYKNNELIIGALKRLTKNMRSKVRNFVQEVIDWLNSRWKIAISMFVPVKKHILN